MSPAQSGVKKTATTKKTSRKFQRHESLLNKEDTLLLIIDYQKKLVDIMEQREAVTPEIVRLIEGAQLMQLPILTTLQYPKSLGPLVDEVAEHVDPEWTVEKLTFSCCGNDDFIKMLKKTKRKQVIVTGIETHICVLQTVLDLIANGYHPHIPALATCSRSDFNRDLAFERMQNAGAILTNTESVLFELLYEAGTDEFKSLQKLIVDRPIYQDLR